MLHLAAGPLLSWALQIILKAMPLRAIVCLKLARRAGVVWYFTEKQPLWVQFPHLLHLVYLEVFGELLLIQK